MTSGDQENEDARLLAWLHAGADDHRDQDEGVKRYLLQGKRERRPLDPYTKALLPPNRRATGPDIDDARRCARGWAGLGYSIDEALRWIRSGAEIWDYELVAELESEGITPERAAEQFEHPRTGELLTIYKVARDHHSFLRKHETFRSLSHALDDAGIERVKSRHRRLRHSKGLA